MKKEVANTDVYSNSHHCVRSEIPTRGRLFAQNHLSAIQLTKWLFIVLLFCSACGKQSPQQPDIKFEKTKWSLKTEGHYTYRKQMVNDLLSNYEWYGVRKDSVIEMLGSPDNMEEGNLMYDYESKPFLGGLGTTIEAIVFELAPDSTVKVARLNDGGWD